MKDTYKIFLIDRFYKQKFLFNIYVFITRIYSRTFSILEKFLLRRKTFDRNFENLGIKKFKSQLNKKQLKTFFENEIKKGSSSIKIVSKNDLHSFLNNVFKKDLREKITNMTGFNFSIDYFKVYENKNIPISNRKYHFDKSFSENMLKVFIPLNVCKESGPLKVYDKINSKLARKETLFKNLKYFLLTGNGESIYCINPNMCFHQEGNPKKNFSSVQIMFQLNPSKKWSYRNDLYQRQFMREKKFTSFTSFFSDNTFFD